MMTRWCGTGLKEPVSTNDYMVSVMFYSDYSLNRLGFNITFTQIKGIYRNYTSAFQTDLTC